MLDVVIDQHRRLLAWQRQMPESRWLTLRYDELIADPAAIVRRVYQHFDIPIDAAQDLRLNAAAADAGEFRKHRKYALEDYGVSRAALRDQLADVFEAHGWEA
jgi:hypothetical protein